MNVEERVKALSEELNELSTWQDAEEAKISLQLKSAGKYKVGLDANAEAYAEIRLEAKRRYREIIAKYNDLPPDTKLKLW